MLDDVVGDIVQHNYYMKLRTVQMLIVVECNLMSLQNDNEVYFDYQQLN